jgi:membrane-associated protease RseP (regulator of RpoE activity)
MKRPGIWIATSAALSLLGSQALFAQDADTEQARKQAELRAEYEAALESAEQEREAAMETVERARAEIERVSEEQVSRERKALEARARLNEEQAQARRERESELARMRAELSRAHEELRQASREVARVHRELALPRVGALTGFVNLGDRAVIGVVLGDSDKTGVHVLGVSPDGPAERAGIHPGDIIVAVEGEKLTSEEGLSAGAVLSEVLEGIEVGDQVLITVERDGQSLDYEVKADRRKPFGWSSMVRLGTAPVLPEVPGSPVIIEKIEVPEIDTTKLGEQMEALREKLDHTRIVLDAQRLPDDVLDLEGTWNIDFDNLSELGETAMLGTTVWFGMPLTRGLKLAEIDTGLGAYFETDRGVLVLKARENNDLQLLAGDVILEVGGVEVNTPSDVMRALRALEPGSDLSINIMRQGKGETIGIVVPERVRSFGCASDCGGDYYFHYRPAEQ